jgi:Spy/CpxP family protein refolding chaperone
MAKKLMCLAVIILMIASASVEAGGGAQCGSNKGHGGGKQGDCAEKLMMKAHCLVMHQEELGLSDEQVEKIKALKYETKKQVIAQDAEIELAELDVKKAMWQDAIAVETVNPLVDRKFELKKEKAKMLIAAYADLQSILTAEQQKELKALKKQIKCEA